MIKFKSVTPTGAFAFGFDVPKLRLDYSGIVVLQGQNGVGKSSIMNSVVQALFGKNDTPGDGDEIANSVLKEGCDIQVEFETNHGNPYIAEYARRFKRPGSSARVTDLFLFDHLGADCRKESMSATFAEIRSILGQDYEQFRATSYLGIQNAPKFLNGTDQERMQTVTPFLGLAVWDNAQKRVRLLNKTALDALAQSKGSYEQLQRNLTTYQNSVLSAEAKLEIETQVAKDKAAIVTAKAELERTLAFSNDAESKLLILESDRVRSENTIRAQKEALAKLARDKVSEIRTVNTSAPEIDHAHLDELNAYASKVLRGHIQVRSAAEQGIKTLKALTCTTGITPGLDRLLGEFRTYEDEKVTKVAQANVVRESLSRIPEGELGECPTCFTQNISAEHLASVRGQFADSLKNDEARIAELGKLIDGIHGDLLRAFNGYKQTALADCTKALATLVADHAVEMATINDDIAAEEACIKTLIEDWRKTRLAQIEKEVNRKGVEIGNALSTAQDDTLAIETEIATLKRDPTRLKSVERMTAIKKSIVEAEHCIRTDSLQLSNSALYEKQAVETQSALEAANVDIEQLEQKVEDLTFLDGHLGDKGIKRYKLANRLGFMNDKLAQYMGILGLPLQVWFQDRVIKKAAQKKKPEALTDDDYSDKFEIFVRDGAKDTVPVGLYSGGERTLISLAILGTLWETSNTFGSGGTNLLMIDEPFGLLAPDSKDRALSLLEYWGSLGKCVIVSDNTDTVSQLGRRASTWQVTKKDHISTIEVIDG